MTNTSTSTELTKSQNITNIREKLGITRKEFSDALGLSIKNKKGVIEMELEELKRGIEKDVKEDK